MYSINDMMNIEKKEDFSDKIFIVESIKENQSERMEKNVQYVQIKRTNYIKNDHFQTII